MTEERKHHKTTLRSSLKKEVTGRNTRTSKLLAVVKNQETGEGILEIIIGKKKNLRGWKKGR